MRAQVKILVGLLFGFALASAGPAQVVQPKTLGQTQPAPKPGPPQPAPKPAPPQQPRPPMPNPAYRPMIPHSPPAQNQPTNIWVMFRNDTRVPLMVRVSGNLPNAQPWRGDPIQVNPGTDLVKVLMPCPGVKTVVVYDARQAVYINEQVNIAVPVTMYSIQEVKSTDKTPRFRLMPGIDPRNNVLINPPTPAPKTPGK